MATFLENLLIQPENIRDLSQLINIDTLRDERIQDYVRVVRAKNGDPVGLIGKGNPIGTAGCGCDPTYGSLAPFNALKRWELGCWVAPLKICYTEMEGTIAEYALKNGTAIGDLNGTQVMSEVIYPIVNDLLMGNYFSSYINHSNLQDASIMAEYVPEQATAATDCYLALGVDAEGRLGFFTKAEGTYMDANSAWLSTENLSMKDVTAIYLVEATAPVIMLGDADGDGVVSIKDVSFLIDYLLNGLPSKDETVGVLNFTGADVNRDGDVNIKDLSILIDQLLTTER